MNVYFSDNEHKQNYENLQAHFGNIDFTKNGEYRATCYLAAYPGIFKCFRLDKQEHGPFSWYFEYLENPDDYADRRDRGDLTITGDPAPLTRQTRDLVNIALSLWNGQKCDLSAIADLDPQLYLVVLQALDLSRRKPSFDYSAYAVQNIDGWDERIFRKMMVE